MYIMCLQKNVSSLERCNQTGQHGKEVKCSMNSQPTLSTSAAVECKDTAECRIINLELATWQHIEDITQHVVKCQTCLKMSQSTDAITIVGEQHHDTCFNYGLQI